MKTQTIHWNHERELKHTARALAADSVPAVAPWARPLGALGLILGAAWLLTVPAWFPLVQVAIWAVAFIHFALAIQAGKGNFRGYVMTGSALTVLALSSLEVAPGFAFMALMMIAVRATAALNRH